MPYRIFPWSRCVSDENTNTWHCLQRWPGFSCAFAAASSGDTAPGSRSHVSTGSHPACWASGARRTFPLVTRLLPSRTAFTSQIPRRVLGEPPPASLVPTLGPPGLPPMALCSGGISSPRRLSVSPARCEGGISISVLRSRSRPPVTEASHTTHRQPLLWPTSQCRNDITQSHG